MKTFQQFMEDQSKNPFINQDTGKQTVGPFDYGHNPPIHKLKSGNRYPNNILDKKGSKELDSYYKEPEVIKFFKDNNSKSPRHSLAFNLIPIGKYGSSDSTYDTGWFKS